MSWYKFQLVLTLVPAIYFGASLFRGRDYFFLALCGLVWLAWGILSHLEAEYWKKIARERLEKSWK